MTNGERIRQCREYQGLSQTALADAIGTTKQNIYKYETGIITNIPSDKIEMIAETLHTTPSFLMGWDNSVKVVISDTDPQLDAVIETAKRLNAQGLTKLGDYADDLAGNPQYAKKQLRT